MIDNSELFRVALLERQFDVAMKAAELALEIARGQNKLLVRCKLLVEEMHGSIYQDDLDWDRINQLYDELVAATDEGNKTGNSK